MNAALITIGDEILIGQTIDTNSAWMGKKLNALGIRVNQITSIKDEREAILESLSDAEASSADFIFITGGLGPTKDDITKHVLCDYFNTSLVRNQKVLEKIELFFKERGREMLETNRQQADLPEACTVLMNEMGTASGMWFEKNDTIFVSMPGVPYEMKGLMKNEVLPRIQSTFDLPSIFHKTIMTEGIGESFLVEMVKDWENSLEKEGIKIAYLPSPGIVRVRLSTQGNKSEDIQTKVLVKAEELKKLVPQYVFGEDDISVQEAIGELLKANRFTVATAESCTGGMIAELLTSVSGSSAYFRGGVVAYSNDIKRNFLDVLESDLEHFGAVSEAVVEQMAKGIQKKMNSDFGIATSGVAGPSGGSDEKPVGTVWIALASKDKVISKKFTFENNRSRNIRRSALAAISMLRRHIQAL